VINGQSPESFNSGTFRIHFRKAFAKAAGIDWHLAAILGRPRIGPAHHPSVALTLEVPSPCTSVSAQLHALLGARALPSKIAAALQQEGHSVQASDLEVSRADRARSLCAETGALRRNTGALRRNTGALRRRQRPRLPLRTCSNAPRTNHVMHHR
jgi:hypothetical protein